MAARNLHVNLHVRLSIEDLKEVIELLRKHNYFGVSYCSLGLQLGLSIKKLEIIEKEHKGDVHMCLMYCLTAWLERNGIIKKADDPSYNTLIQALHKIGDKAVADGIHKELHPACDILSTLFSEAELEGSCLDLHRLATIPEILIQPIIGDLTLTSLRKDIQEVVCKDHQNLLKFAYNLENADTTCKEIGGKIRKEYLKTFQPSEPTTCTLVVQSGIPVIPEEIPEYPDKIPLLKKSIDRFTQIRAKYATAVYRANEAIMSSKIPKEKLKSYLRAGYPHLKFRQNESKQEILYVISNNNSLADVSLFEAVADEFKINAAQKAIKKYKEETIPEYKEEVKRVCENTPLSEYLDKKISGGPRTQLKCEEIIFVVGQNVKDSTINDVREIIGDAFGEYTPTIKVKVIRTGNSFSITCSFPLTLSEPLILIALQNLELLKKRGLQKLTIGYCTLYSQCKHKEQIRSGFLEQLLVSTTVQLKDCSQDKKSLLEEIDETEAKIQKKIQSQVQIELKSFEEKGDEKIISKSESQNEVLPKHELSEGLETNGALQKLANKKQDASPMEQSQQYTKQIDLTDTDNQLPRNRKETVRKMSNSQYYEIDKLRQERDKLHQENFDLKATLNNQTLPLLQLTRRKQKMTLSPQAIATLVRHRHIINADSFIEEVSNMFRKYHYLGTKYYELGSELQLPKDRLESIKENFGGDLDRCLLECLLTWQNNPGEKTWEKLIIALRKIKEKPLDLAEKIYHEKFRACDIFSSFYLQLFEAIDEPLELANALHTAGVLEEVSTVCTINETTEERVNVLLIAVQHSICKSKTNLIHFALALKKFQATTTVGDDILEEYGPMVKTLILTRAWHKEFVEMRQKFEKTMEKVCSSSTLTDEDLKTAIEKSGHQCKLAEAQKMHILKKETSLADVGILQAIATGSKEVCEYEKEMKKLLEDIKTSCPIEESSKDLFQYRVEFDTYPPAENCTLADAKDTLSKALGIQII